MFIAFLEKHFLAGKVAKLLGFRLFKEVICFERWVIWFRKSWLQILVFEKVNLKIEVKTYGTFLFAHICLLQNCFIKEIKGKKEKHEPAQNIYNILSIFLSCSP